MYIHNKNKDVYFYIPVIRLSNKTCWRNILKKTSNLELTSLFNTSLLNNVTMKFIYNLSF